MNRIFTHAKTGNLYKVIGYARCIKNPKRTKIIYEQLSQSTLKGTNLVLPRGTMWMRAPNDFEKKFVLTSLDESTINAYILSERRERKTKTKDNTFTVDDVVNEVSGAILQTAQVITDLGRTVVKKAGKIVKKMDDLDR